MVYTRCFVVLCGLVFTCWLIIADEVTLGPIHRSQEGFEVQVLSWAGEHRCCLLFGWCCLALIARAALKGWFGIFQVRQLQSRAAEMIGERDGKDGRDPAGIAGARAIP